jgi:transcriptional regulator with XRE-family HTH domain
MSIDGLGDRIKGQRETRGMKRSELARRVDVTPAAVYNWEEIGARPRGSMIANIARVLGTTEDYLLTGAQTATTSVPVSTPRPTSSNSPHIGQRTVKEIIEAARVEIASLTGAPHAKVRLNLTIDWNDENL